MIYVKDEDGLYTADPKKDSTSKYIPRISVEELLELDLEDLIVDRASSPFNSMRCHRETGLARSAIRNLGIVLHHCCDPVGSDLAKDRSASCRERQTCLQSPARRAMTHSAQRQGRAPD